MTQGFDEWMNKNHSGAFDMPHQRDCYEAGAASQQAEIDELKKRIDFLEQVICENLDERFLSVDFKGEKQ